MNNKIGLMVAVSLLPAAALAQQDDSLTQQQTSTQQQMPPEPDTQEKEDTILVRSTPTSQSMGTQILTAEQIKQFPTANGTIPELLKHNPNVRFSNATDSSNTPGELAPENVSFHGEKFYNNNFMIDGLSNNNTINPGANGGNSVTRPMATAPPIYRRAAHSRSGLTLSWSNSWKCSTAMCRRNTVILPAAWWMRG